MKKVMNWWLMAAVVLGIGFGFTACSDDDDDNNGTEQRSDVDPLDNDEARTAFRWLCVLSNVQTLDANWQSKTYEPSVGEASENSEYTRIVVVNDLEEAKMDFSKLADKDPSELGAKVTISGGAAGTMTWEPSAAGAQNLAVVTVTSRIMPHLQKIVYCTEDQKGQNGSLFGNNMKGTAYYRFGDVIQDSEGYYWVCVRPCFAPAKSSECSSKGDSHWINIFNASAAGGKTIPDANIISKWDNLDKYKNQTILLPTKLPYDRQHIYNLSQLVAALLNPTQYADINTGYDDRALGGFPYQYNGKKFVEAVAQYWNEADENGATIWQKLFNHTYEEMKTLKVMKFIYQGYSWTWGNSGNVWVYSCTGYAGKYVGSTSDDKVSIDFVNQGFNVRYFAQENVEAKKAVPWKRFVNANEGGDKPDGTWVVRYKKGEDLMTAGKFSYYSQITSRDGNTKDVYRYNEKQAIAAGENITPQTENEVQSVDTKPLTTPVIGSLVTSDGKFYANRAAAQKANATPVAMVIFVGGKNNYVEENDDNHYNALAMALTNVKDSQGTTQFAWSDQASANHNCGYDEDIHENDRLKHQLDPHDMKYYYDGIAITKRLATHECNENHRHPAAEVVYNLPAPVNAAGFSKWFIPSLGQFKMVLEGMGLKKKATTKWEGSIANWPWGAAGYPDSNFATIWTCTETTLGYEGVVFYGAGEDHGNQYDTWNKETKAVIRPLLAFTVK